MLSLLGLVAGGTALLLAAVLSFLAAHCLLSAGASTGAAAAAAAGWHHLCSCWLPCLPAALPALLAAGLAPRTYAGAVGAALGGGWAVVADVAVALNSFGEGWGVPARRSA